MTSIEWTEATWNPIAGCSVLSPGCTNCYAMRTAARLGRIEATAPVYAGLTQPSKAGPVWTGKIAVNEKALLDPLRRRKPTMYFVNSMSDLFHESVPDEVIDRVFAVMALCPQHTFQVLTKRSARMREYFATDPHHLTSRMESVWAATAEFASAKVRLKQLICNALTLGKFRENWPLPNVWLGVSVEDQKRADERIPDLLATPVAVRFLSCEPLLGPLGLEHIQARGADYKFSAFEPQGHTGARIDWVIVGGESGPGARPMHPDWARSLRDQCADAGVPFFFKQWGEWTPSYGHPSGTPGRFAMMAGDPHGFTYTSATHLDHYPRQFISFGSVVLERRSKKAAGRWLDGVTHDAMPQVQRHG